jgi:S1-C subfamily serine protease
MSIGGTFVVGAMLLGVLFAQVPVRAEGSPLSARPSCAAPLRSFDEGIGIGGAPVAHVWGVEPSSVAQEAGFQAGDLILGLGGRGMRDFIDFRDFVTELRLAAIQMSAEVDLLRPEPGGDLRLVRVKAILPRSYSSESGRYLGLQCSFDYVVLSVPEGSEAEKAGLRRGDLVSKVGGTEVRRLEGANALDLKVQEALGEPDGKIQLRVSRWRRSEAGKWEEIEVRETRLPLSPAAP